MHTTVLLYWCTVFLSLFLTVSTLYVPMMKTSSRRLRSRQYPDSESSEHNNNHATWNKRGNVYGVFARMMTRHATRHRNDQAFVDRMFNIFDLNGNRVVERLEFKAVLQLLGIVSHDF